MATYAAYRHVELDNVGYGKKRVLKPPGGGSSDIFGATCEVDSPRRSKQSSTVNQSQLGSTFFDNDKQVTTNGNAISPTESNFNSAPVNINKPGGNPVTGTGYAGGDQLGSSPTQNGSVTGSTGSAGSEKSSTDSSPSVPSVNRFRNRIPPGGYSSGLW